MGRAAKLKRARAQLYAPVPWTPFVRVHTVTHGGVLVPVSREATGFDEAYENSRYFVLLRRIASPLGPCTHLSLRRADRDAVHDWREMQRIKNELVGPEVEALELYPAESRLVDQANQFHLWCFPGARIPIGFDQRAIAGPDDGCELAPNARQRPFDTAPSSRSPTEDPSDA